MISIFLERTIELLKNRPRNITYALIAEETGLGEAWLESLVLERNKGKLDPGVKRIEKLFVYLGGTDVNFIQTKE